MTDMIDVPGFKTSDDIRKLKLYLWNNLRHYNFDLGGFRIPKFIESYNSLYTSRVHISIEENRNGKRDGRGNITKPGLLQRRQEGELSFVKFYKSLLETYDKNKNGDFIEQFPLLITNRSLWLECCDLAGCMIGKRDANGKVYRDTRYFVFDLYIPRPKIVFELDYDSTHPCPEYDNARDLYVGKKYGIKTVRFRDYKKDREKTIRINREVQKLLNVIMSDSEIPNPEKFDFTAFSIESFKLDYKFDLDIFAMIREDYESCDDIRVTEKELKRYYKVAKHEYKGKVSIDRMNLFFNTILGKSFTIR